MKSMARKKQEWVHFECEKSVEHLGITVKGQVRVDRSGRFTWYTTHYFRKKDAVGFYLPTRVTEDSLSGAQFMLEWYLDQFDDAVECRHARYL